ncbi:YqgQ family protein [Lederbergia graminis]|uniref:YqgQ family protein n=1 Tax=Lederbergia graminis TaxID=735518 RepID=A0ABW0LB97_9BACI
MNSVYDVQQLLKKFGTIVYIGERMLDLEIMESELKELYFHHFISIEELQLGLAILRNEMKKEEKKREG